MNIGQNVISELYREYGEGTIISSSKLFDKQFYKVFFDNISKIIELPEDDLKPIDDHLKFNRRISDYFKNIEDVTLFECKEETNRDIGAYHQEAEVAVNELAENIFWELERNWKLKIEADNKKIGRYYNQKAKAIEQIPIDNIRSGKQTELRREREQKIQELKKQAQLFPDLDCFQIAWVEFR